MPESEKKIGWTLAEALRAGNLEVLIALLHQHAWELVGGGPAGPGGPLQDARLLTKEGRQGLGRHYEAILKGLEPAVARGDLAAARMSAAFAERLAQLS